MNDTLKAHNTCQKLNKDHYSIKSLRDSVSTPVLRNVYFTKFESILKYGIIFCGGVNDSNAVFRIQGKRSKLIKGVKNRVACRSFFGDYKILIVTYLCIF
jgi:hypothetical protein